MANTLTSLITDVFAALDVVSRELVGFIPAATLDANVARAAVGEAVRTAVTPAAVASDIVPGVTAPNDGDQVIGNRTITITKSRGVPFRWNGEEQRGLNVGGPGYLTIRQDQIAQAIRTLTNEVEADFAALHITTSRAFGLAATTPFATNLGDPAQIRKILVDNGAPNNGMQLVIDTTAGAALRTLAQLTKVNEAADESMLRQGLLLPLHGLDVRESAAVKVAVTVGTGSAYTSSTAGFAIGATSIAIITGTGTVLAGDIVTFAGDTNKYVVTTGVAAPGTIVLAEPGLRKALAASAVAMTIVAASTRNMAFHRSAMVGALRAPALPQEGDSAAERFTVVDPRSGIPIEISLYAQYRQVRYEAALAWGVANMAPRHTAILLG
jgi:hypothetical protein